MPARRAKAIGHRISDMTLDNGKPLEAGKTYKVAGWASVNPQEGKPVTDVFASYLRTTKDRAAEEAQQGRAQGRRRQSGHLRLRNSMARFRIDRFAACAFVALAALSLPAVAQDAPRAAPIIDKPFAEHHLALQLSDNDPKKAGADAQRRLQSAQILRSRPHRHRGRHLRPRHRSVARRQRAPRRGRQPRSRKACSSTSA